MNNEERKKGSGLMARAEAINEAMADNSRKLKEEESKKEPEMKKEKPKRTERPPKRRESSTFSRILSKIIIILILLCSLVAGGLFAIKYFRSSILQSPIAPVVTEKKSVIIQDQLLYCQEFVSMKYRYSDIVSIKKSTKIGFSKSYSIVKYSGIVRVGIADMSACTYVVSDDEKSVIVTLPAAQVLGNEIVSQEVFDEQQSIFVPITLDEVFTEIEKSREDALAEILSEGILTESREYAKKIVRQILLTAGFEEVTVL